MYSVMFVKKIIFLTFLENFESLIFFFFFHHCGAKRIRSFDREIVESWGENPGRILNSTILNTIERGSLNTRCSWHCAETKRVEKRAGDARGEGGKTWDYFQRLKIPTAERLLGKGRERFDVLWSTGISRSWGESTVAEKLSFAVVVRRIFYNTNSSHFFHF